MPSPHAAAALSPATPRLPRPPSPSADKGITPHIEDSFEDSSILPASDEIDVFTLSPVAALKMLCETIESLVRVNGEAPPTSPTSQTGTPNIEMNQAEKENVAIQIPRTDEVAEDVDGVPLRAKTPIGSPETGLSEHLQVIGSKMKSLKIQHNAITRKFYSKKPPPIALEEYLLRMHCYCPMSTAVYLATSLYIHRLAIVERIIPVTTRNVHRLVLAGLRVAMKALEDLSYPHRRFSKVGGVSERELGRLEVSFCFIIDFELKVDREMLLEHAKSIRDGTILFTSPLRLPPKLLPLNENRGLALKQRSQATVVNLEASIAA